MHLGCTTIVADTQGHDESGERAGGGLMKPSVTAAPRVRLTYTLVDDVAAAPA